MRTSVSSRARRTSAVAAVAAVFTLAIAGCAPSGGDSGADEEITGPVTIQFANFMVPWEDQLKEVVADFEKENPDITVDLQTAAFADYNTSLQAALAAEDDPTIFQPVTLTQQLAQGGRTVDLKAEMGDEFISQFVESSTGQAEYEGGIYAIPWAAQMFGLNYNKTLFDKYGWELPKTWDDLIDLAAQIRKDAGITPVSIPGSGGNALADFYWPLITQIEDSTDLAYALDAHTDPDVSWDSKPVVDSLTLLQKIVDGGVFDPAVLSIDQDAAYSAFYNGQAAMLYVPSSALTPLRNQAQEFVDTQMGLAQIPALTADDRHWTGDQAGYTIAVSSKASSQEKAAAYKFLKFLYEPDRYLELQNAAASLPATKDGLDGVEDEFVKTYAGWLADGDGAPHISFGAGTGEAVGTGVAKIFAGEGTPEEVATGMEASVVQSRKL